MEGGALFLPALERLQTLYPGAYARGSTSTYEGAYKLSLDIKVSARTQLIRRFQCYLGGVDPSPTRPSSLGSLPITGKSWLDGGSAYGGQSKIDVSTLAGPEDVLVGKTERKGAGLTENPPPPPPPTHRG